MVETTITSLSNPFTFIEPGSNTINFSRFFAISNRHLHPWEWIDAHRGIKDGFVLEKMFTNRFWSRGDVRITFLQVLGRREVAGA
eukprot:5942193-Prymnesium_polylepis.3